MLPACWACLCQHALWHHGSVHCYNGQGRTCSAHWLSVGNLVLAFYHYTMSLWYCTVIYIYHMRTMLHWEFAVILELLISDGCWKILNLVYNYYHFAVIYLEKSNVMLTVIWEMRRLIFIAKIKTLTWGLGLGFDCWPFDLRVSACRGPAMDICLPTLVLIASRFLFRAWTNRQTDAAECPTPRRWQGISHFGELCSLRCPKSDIESAARALNYK